MKIKAIKNSILGLFIFILPNFLHAYQLDELSKLTVEELRLSKAKIEIPHVFNPLKERVKQFSQLIDKAQNYAAIMQLVIRHSNGLWQDAIQSFNKLNNYDDRSLYWARLEMARALRKSSGFKRLLPVQQRDIQWQLELLSRGKNDVSFDQKVDKKILLTGFDPFFLDKNINQSNPSGAVALALDDLILFSEEKSVEIETLVVPVRFSDFDQGMIEQLLTPFYAKVDMIVTVSMGRDGFDLERFPGLRRSAKAPDNLNVFTSASKSDPKPPKLHNKPLQGPEFVEFSLPVEKMLLATGKYPIKDNRLVLTSDKKLTAQSLDELTNSISVEGSGGGYLSNEISYRSIILRNRLEPTLPVGHIHTPRIKGFEPSQSEDIINQIKQMLRLSIDQI